jgi:predicted DNA-binding transcriptional regulator AlpA
MPHPINSLPPAALTIDEACAYSRLSRATLYRLMGIPNSPLRTAKIGARRVVIRESIDTLLATGAAINAVPSKAA